MNRVKAKKENVAVTDVFQALQVYLGSFYINDFNYLGRTYRVIAQADAPFRATPPTSPVKTRNAAGAMVPLGTVMDMKTIADTDRINRYQHVSFRRHQRRGRPRRQQRAGHRDHVEYRRKDASAADSATNGPKLPIRRSRQATPRIGFSRSAYCLYSSRTRRNMRALRFRRRSSLSCRCACCAASRASISARLDNNIFTQIGFVVLAGMSVKNAVLIVEFAKQEQEHNPKMRAADAAVEAARSAAAADPDDELRLHFRRLAAVVRHRRRPEMRHALGTVVFYGMIGVTFFGLFLTPVFYAVIRRLRGDLPMRGPAGHREAETELVTAEQQV